MKLGLISDTHGRLDRRVFRIFAGVDAIIHGGDIGGQLILDELATIAPVTAIRGNNDDESIGLPLEREASFEGRRFLIAHLFGEAEKLNRELKSRLERERPDVVVFGHSHKPYKGKFGSTILINPGGAGPRRFNLPRSVAILQITRASFQVHFRYLDGGVT